MPARPETLGTRRKLAVVLALASLINYGRSLDRLSESSVEAASHNVDLGLSVGLSRIALTGYDQTIATSTDGPVNQVSIGKISQSFESKISQANTSPINDATSTNTPDWRCIKQAEGSNANGNYTQISGAFGFLISSWAWTLQKTGIATSEQYPVPGDAPPEIQDEAALFLLAYNHYHFKGAWNDYCTYDGIVK